MKEIKLIMKAFGSVCEVVAATLEDNEENVNQVIISVREYLFDLDDRLSVFKSESEIAQLNRAELNEAITVSPDTFDLLKESKRYAASTGGIFDVTVGKSTERWRRERKEMKSGATGITFMENAEGLLLDEVASTAKKTMQSLEVDLGGIAKGYAIDRVREMLLSGGISDALINFGGTISVIGAKAKIGLRNPFIPRNSHRKEVPFCSVSCNDEVIVTSGIYEQSIGNEFLSHHIIDPSTGRPCKTDLLSATVISKSGADADAYATALIVLGLRGSLKFAKEKNFPLF